MNKIKSNQYYLIKLLLILINIILLVKNKMIKNQIIKIKNELIADIIFYNKLLSMLSNIYKFISISIFSKK